MVFEYKGTDYEFPDDMDDEQALKLIKQDLGEDQTPQPEPTLAQPEPSLSQQLGEHLGQHTAEMKTDPIGGAYRAGGAVAKSALQTLGKVFEPVTKPLVEGIVKPAARFVAENSNLSPEAKQALSATGKLVGKGVDYYKKNVPEGIQEDVAATGEYLSVLPVEKMLGFAGRTLANVPADIKGIAPKIESAASRIEGTKVKINAPEQKMGAKNEYYSKYNVFGDAKSVQSQWIDKIKSTSDELKAKIASVKDDPNVSVNMLDILSNAENRVLEQSDFGRKAVRREINNALNDIIDKYGDEAGNLNLVDAQMIKRSAGKHGDWYENPFGGKSADNSNIKSKVYNTIYDELKNDLEDKGPEGIKELNKQLSEMIPMERAASKQILVQSRKNPISFDDYVGGIASIASAAAGNLAPAALAGVNMATKSPNVAKGLYNIGQSAGKANFLYQPKKLATPTDKLLGMTGVGVVSAQNQEKPFKSKQKVKLAQPITKPEDFLIGKNR